MTAAAGGVPVDPPEPRYGWHLYKSETAYGRCTECGQTWAAHAVNPRAAGGEGTDGD